MLGFEPMEADGDNVDPTVTYRLTPFIANSGWPCPQYISPTGDTFHFGDTRDILGADLIAGTTFVIHHPSTEEC